MRKTNTLLAAALLSATAASAQFSFSPEIQPSYTNDSIVMPASPLTTQVLFIGGYHQVQTTATYGNAATAVPAKQWHDFIGVTPDTDPTSSDYAWISVNHEMIEANDNVGDGGGMTVFKVRRDPNTDTLIIVDQTLTDGRAGKFFNVDFANTVGETGMNCGGITSTVDGRIWTAEEWFRSDNNSINDSDAGVRDTTDFTIAGSGISGTFDGEIIKKYQNFNWMVEIDPREAKAIRKQYNWGRQPFEGGVVMPDNKTVYTGADNTPGFMSKFVADVAGDFTSGKLYVYKHDAPNKWVELDNSTITEALNVNNQAVLAGATMFNRLEWVAYNPADGNVYFTETGRDAPASRWRPAHAAGAVHAPHTLARAMNQNTHPDSAAYRDYYGRILKLDVSTDEVTSYLEGGPALAQDSVPMNQYPSVHLSNPDGLNFLSVNGETYMLICEDLNGSSYGRVPGNIKNRTCEMYMLNVKKQNPGLNDLVRIAVVPDGAEITGVTATPDGKTVLFNSQHPSSAHAFPWNNSLTVAITGWDKIVTSTLEAPEMDKDGFSIFPNPTTRFLQLNTLSDIAIYNAAGQRVLVARNTQRVDVSHLAAGTYFVQNANGITKTLIIQ